jgi:hypothetical protein
MTYPQIMTVVILIVISILFSVFNGLVIKWKLTNDAKLAATYSEWWHVVGGLIHILMVGQVLIIGGWIWGLITFFVVWLIHNIVIAKMMKQKWYYVGKTAKTDILIRKILFFINFD